MMGSFNNGRTDTGSAGAFPPRNAIVRLTAPGGDAGLPRDVFGTKSVDAATAGAGTGTGEGRSCPRARRSVVLDMMNIASAKGRAEPSYLPIDWRGSQNGVWTSLLGRAEGTPRSLHRPPAVPTVLIVGAGEKGRDRSSGRFSKRDLGAVKLFPDHRTGPTRSAGTGADNNLPGVGAAVTHRTILLLTCWRSLIGGAVCCSERKRKFPEAICTAARGMFGTKCGRPDSAQPTQCCPRPGTKDCGSNWRVGVGLRRAFRTAGNAVFVSAIGPFGEPQIPRSDGMGRLSAGDGRWHSGGLGPRGLGRVRESP